MRRASRGLQRQSIPDVFFIDSKGKVVDRLKTFQEPEPFLKRVQKMASKREKTATLGIETGAPSERAATALDLSEKVRILGRVIIGIEPKSAAAKAGLEVSDVLLRFGNNDLYSADDIADYLDTSKPWDQVGVVYRRSGSTTELEAVLTLGEVGLDVAPGPRPRPRGEYSGLAQLAQAFCEARAKKKKKKKKKKKVFVGLSGTET